MGKSNKILDIFKRIPIIITSPIWYPWKLLFVRKEERKFKNVDTKTKIFRITRSFITKPLKFCIYLFIIAIELLLVYKVRFSVLTYPLTRHLVYNYYINNTTPKDKLLGIDNISASDLSNHKDELKQAFNYIDTWNLDEKNKMYVLLDAKITKIVIKYTDGQTLNYILNRFNSDEVFRDDVKNAAKNVNKTLARGIKEFPEVVHIEELNTTLSPILSISAYAVDYREILDMLGTISDYILESSEYEVIEEESYYNEADINDWLDMVINYSKGMSIQEVYDIANRNYLQREDAPETENQLYNREIEKQE